MKDLYDNRRNHKIIFLPFPEPDNEGFKAILNNKFDAIATSALMVLFLVSPLLTIQKFSGLLKSRNRALNPIGSKTNLVQSFGADSKSIVIEGYVSSINLGSGGGSDFDQILQKANLTLSNNNVMRRFKVDYLKTATQYQRRFLVIDNNDYDIVIINSIQVDEDADDPFIYRVRLECISVRPYETNEFYLQLIGNSLVNQLSQSIADVAF